MGGQEENGSAERGGENRDQNQNKNQKERVSLELPANPAPAVW